MSSKCIIGDCREVLKTLPSNSIDCCITSPPYFGLRNYNHPNQIGMENAPDKYVNELVQVFREVKRVLKDDGTIWLNLGDSYYYNTTRGTGGKSNKQNSNTGSQFCLEKVDNNGTALKSKDLIGIPWRVAFALQADGWYLRQDIIWSKGNPMPESVKDRCTKAHEYIFLLSKSQKYYFDYESIREPQTRKAGPVKRNVWRPQDPSTPKGSCPDGRTVGSPADGKRNKRSVWNINTSQYNGAHFATFPKALVEPCVLAGCPVGGTVLDPFGGSGTVGEVCNSIGRNSILIELNPEYEQLILNRTKVNNSQLTSFSSSGVMHNA